MNEKKMYSVKELSSILGCSVTAVNKKIISDPDNPNIKRYRNRYDVVIDEGKTVILLSDEDIEREKRLSKGFKNVTSNVNETPENVVDVEYSAESQVNKEDVTDKLIKFSSEFFQRYETLQTRYINLLTDTNNQIKLLTDSESKTQKEYFEMSSRCKELEERNKNLKRYLIIATVIFLVIITLLIFIRNV